jgi:hypothetical protein
VKLKTAATIISAVEFSAQKKNNCEVGGTLQFNKAAVEGTATLAFVFFTAPLRHPSFGPCSLDVAALYTI